MFRLFWVIVLLGILGGSGYYAYTVWHIKPVEEPPQMITVRKETFKHEILERGSIESASNVDIRCEVESAGGLAIIGIVPEGTVVKKGDFLVEFDSSTLRENVTKQQIAVLASKSKLAQSEANLKTARLTLTEYIEGTFNQDKKTIENEIFAAEEDVRTKEDNLSYYKRLLEKGYITDAKVAADIIDLDKAVNSRGIAELKLKVLTNYTKEKNVTDYEAKIASAQSQVDSDKQSLQLDEDRLKHLEYQLAKCRITAPQDGQVVYYMPRWGGDDEMIKEGKKVLERQIVILLPDVQQMQMKGLVNEATVRLVKVGQKAAIRLEAFPNQVLAGEVKMVNDYPEPSNWMGGSMSKEYMTTIGINDPPAGIKTGLTAEARITVNTIENALVVPVQSVLEHNRKMYVLAFTDGVWNKKEIKVGVSNGKETVVSEGLNEGDSVVLGAAVHRDKVDFPKEKAGEKPTDKPQSADIPVGIKPG